MSPTRLVLVRHGRAHCNVRGVIGGPRGCTGLTDHGRHQTRQLADRLHTDHARAPITAAYTTPLPRARESADITAKRLALHHQRGRPARTRLRRRGRQTLDRHGRRVRPYPGPTPRPPHRPRCRALDQLPPAGHRDLACHPVRHAGGTVLVVGHGETVTAAAHLFLDLDAALRGSVGFAAHYASITRWEQQPLAWTQPDAGWRWTLLAHNDTAHLTP